MSNSERRRCKTSIFGLTVERIRIDGRRQVICVFEIAQDKRRNRIGSAGVHRAYYYQTSGIEKINDCTIRQPIPFYIGTKKERKGRLISLPVSDWTVELFSCNDETRDPVRGTSMC